MSDFEISMSVLLTGLVVVFVVLIALTFIIQFYSNAIHKKNQQNKPAVPAKPEMPVSGAPKFAPPPVLAVEEGIPGEVVAAICAAVYMACEGGSAPVIRSVKRAPAQGMRSAWGQAGRLEGTRPF